MSKKLLATLLIASSLGGLQWLQGIIVPPSSFILRSGEELDSLRRLLDDSVAWPELLSIAERMALWRVSTIVEPASEEETCLPLQGMEPPGQKIRHSFEFSSNRGLSSRVYRLDYSSCKRGEGMYDVRRTRAGFGSDFALGDEPFLAGTDGLKVLRLAFHDTGVSVDLVQALQEKDIAFCQVVRELTVPGAALLRFRFIAADGPPDSPETGIVLRYDVEYDPMRQTASFIRL